MSVLCMYAEGVCCRMDLVETCTHCVFAWRENLPGCGLRTGYCSGYLINDLIR